MCGQKGCQSPLIILRLRVNCQRLYQIGCHSSAQKYVTIVRGKIVNQVNGGHIVVFPLSLVCDLPGLWLLTMASILQDDQRNRFIYDLT